jgi:hypothetical protein
MGWVQWVFSGIGVFALSLFVGKQITKSKKIKQVQKSGKGSTNYQSAGNMTIHSKKEDE